MYTADRHHQNQASQPVVKSSLAHNIPAAAADIAKIS
jgi:hypothetical protein